MDIEDRKATDFSVLPAPSNNCAGCWFAGKQVNRLPMCWAAKSNELVKQVFAANRGSCKGVIAVLKNSINDSVIISHFNDYNGKTPEQTHQRFSCNSLSNSLCNNGCIRLVHDNKRIYTLTPWEKRKAFIRYAKPPQWPFRK